MSRIIGFEQHLRSTRDLLCLGAIY